MSYRDRYSREKGIRVRLAVISRAFKFTDRARFVLCRFYKDMREFIHQAMRRTALLPSKSTLR
jgi:hypothetical protein